MLDENLGLHRAVGGVPGRPCEKVDGTRQFVFGVETCGASDQQKAPQQAKGKTQFGGKAQRIDPAHRNLKGSRFMCVWELAALTSQSECCRDTCWPDALGSPAPRHEQAASRTSS